jgi:type II secretory pathway component PulM
MQEGDVIEIEQLRSKQAELEQQLQNLSGEFARLSMAAVADDQRFKLIEQKSDRHEDDIRQLKDSTRIMQIQFEQVMGKIDTLEMKLFNWLQQTQKESAKERTTLQKSWMDIFKYTLSGTIIVIVAAIFLKGWLFP